jgi:translation initiation factor IF-2
MHIRHLILTAFIAVAMALAATADAKGPRGKPAAKPAPAAAAATPGPRPGAGQAARPGLPAAAIPGQGPRPGMMHVKPGHNPKARVTFNVPAAQGRAGAPRTTASSAAAARPNATQPAASGHRAPAATQAPRHAYTPIGSSGTVRDTRRDAGTWKPTQPVASGGTGTSGSAAGARDTRRDAGTWRPVSPAASGSHATPRDTRRDAGRWPAVNPTTPAGSALKPPSPAQAPTRRDARPAGETTGRATPQPTIQQIKSSKNANGDGRVSTRGQGPKPADDNARQLADFMLIESTMQQQRAPRTPEQ